MANGEYGIESRIARVEQRVTDLSGRLAQMEPLAVSVAALTERVQHLLAALGSVEERLEDDRKDRVASRRATWALVVMLLCALIGAGALIAVTGGH